ncbi:MAG: amino acid adenylation domain-containing protein [Kofleriaceae bacterium]
MSQYEDVVSPTELETLIHVLAARACATPEHPAFIFLTDRGQKEERLSYAETLRRVRKVAAFLQGVAAPGDRIVLLYPPGLEYVVAFLGCLHAGMIALPLYPPRRNQRLLRVEEIFRNASPSVALTSASLHDGIREFLAAAPEYARTSLYSTSELRDELADAAGPIQARGEALAFLQYTSGSTGAPKGVMVGHQNLMANNRALRSIFAYERSDEAFANWLPLYHDMGLIGNVLQPLYAGVPSVLMSPISFIQSPMSWLAAITRYRASVAGAPNFAYDLCVERITPAQLATLDLRHWRIAYNGSEPIRAATLARFTQKFAAAGFRAEQLFPCYGMAEATLVVSASEVVAPPIVRTVERSIVDTRALAAPEQPGRTHELVGCGKIVPLHRVSIVDPESRRALPDGQVGEIWIHGPSVAAGYWNNLDATHAAFGVHTADGDGPFMRSGDLGFLEAGELFVTGRIKELIIVRGRNHYPQQIEAVASQCHPALRSNSAAAFGVDLDGEERVVLVQEIERGAKDTDWSQVFPLILNAVADAHELALHAIVLIRVNALPKTSSGKIQRGAARAAFLSGELEAIAQWRRDGGGSDSTRPGGDAPAAAPPPAPAALPAREQAILEELQALGAAMLRKAPEELAPTRPLLELGLDSLALMRLLGEISARFGVELELRAVLEELPTLSAVARHLAAALPAGPSVDPEVPRVVPELAEASAALAALQASSPSELAAVVSRLMDQHMQVVAMALQLLGGQPPGGLSDPPTSPGTGGSPGGGQPRRDGAAPTSAAETNTGATAATRASTCAPRASAASAASAAQVSTPEVVRRRPLSFAQQRMWFLHQLAPSSSAYTIAAELHLDGDLDATLLERCVRDIVRRHDALRTTFAATDDGEGAQIVTPGDDAALPRVATIELDHLPPAERAAAADELARTHAALPFDLERGPLLRARLVRLTPTSHTLQLELHHIVADGWSLTVFLRELAELYRGAVDARPAPLAALALQYADAVELQRQRVEGAELERNLAYWASALEGAPELLELPTDRPRGAAHERRGGHVEVTVPRAVTEALTQLSRERGATLFMTLLAALQILLGKHSRQRDVVVGTPFSGRSRRASHELIGLFVNTLPLRARLREEESFLELLEQVRHTVLGAFAHQETPFERIVEAVGAGRALEHTPVYQALFTLQNLPEPELTLPGLTLRARERPTVDVKLDLELSLRDVDGALRGTFAYDAKLFDEATAAGLARHYVNLLEEIVAAPAARIGALALDDAAERETLARWNATERALDARCLHELIVEQAARTPEQIALIFGQQAMSYRDLLARASQLAAYLSRRGVGPDVVVAVLLERSLEFVVSVLGVLLSGGAYLPLDPEHPAERLSFAVRDARAPMLLTTQTLAGRATDHGAEVLCLDASWPRLAAEPTTPPTSRCAPDNLAYVIYTSGSTGRPKGVENHHRGIVNRLAWHQQRFPISIGDKVLHKTPATFDVSVWELFWPLVTGATMVIARPGGHGDPKYLGDLLREHDITCAHFVPSMLRAFLDGLERERRWPSLRWLLCSGEALSPELVRAGQERLGDTELHNLYGPTEAAVDVTHWRCPPGDARAFVPIGRAVDNTQLHVVDAALRPTAIDVPGELCIAGVQVARGYLHRPSLTAERFVPDPFSAQPGARMYRTGDAARFRPDGLLEFLGRLDTQVKLRGLRIELGEVEAALAASPAVRHVVAMIREDLPGDQRLTAYVAPALDAAAVEDLRRALAERLPSYMIPTAILSLDALPLTSSGKLDRRALPAPPAPAHDEGAPAVGAPRTALEAALAHLWAGVLGRAHVAVSDHFFKIGGHSLSATQVIARLARELSVTVPLRTLFEAPVLASFAERVACALRERGRATDHAELRPLPRSGGVERFPTSFAQERLIFLQELERDSAAYHMPAALHLQGQLDRGALAAALADLIGRHEVLRTTFVSGDEGRTSQRVEDASVATRLDRLPLEHVDLTHLTGEARHVELARLEATHANAPFDLTRGPLLRTKLLRLAEHEHLWLFAMHHVISDGWSIGVLVRELSELYAAHLERRAPRLPALPLQYADYAHWQREHLRGPLLDAELAYWREELAGVPEGLELPTDHPRGAEPGARGGAVEVWIPAELTRALDELGRSADATLFMVLLAGWQLLLHRYSRQDDVVVGCPVANRTRDELEGVLGLFVNSLALRARFEGNPTFTDLLAQVRDTALRGYAHQLVPFERVVEALGVTRDLRRTPVFQVLFTLQNAPMAPLQLPGLVLREHQLPTHTAKLDLDLTLRQLDGGLRGTLEYNADLFAADTAERMVAHLVRLLTAIAKTPRARLDALPWLGDAEQRALVIDRNRTAADLSQILPGWHPDAGFGELFEAQVARAPERVAVECEGRQVTYGELARRARRVAYALAERGAGAEDVIALLADRDEDFVAGVLGILLAGAAYMPLDPEWPTARMRTVSRQSHARLVLASAGYRATAAELDDVPVVELSQALANEAPAGWATRPGTAHHLAYVLFTSGSTGAPKGVMVPHAAMLNQQLAKLALLALGADDTIAQTARQSFDISVWQLLTLLLVGGRVLVLRGDQAWVPPRLLAALTDHQVTLAELVPSHLASLLDHLDTAPTPCDLRALRWMMPTGEALPPELCRRWFRRFPDVPLVNAYGPAECADDTSLRKLTRAPATAFAPIDGTVANVTYYVLDRWLRVVPDGVPGELCIGGAGPGRGYISEPGRTAAAFVPDPFTDVAGARMYRTGDLVRYRRDGELEFLGRVDHQVKLRGFRIELGEIEAALLAVAPLQYAAAVVRHDPPSEPRLVAYLVPRAGRPGDLDEAALRRALEARLPAYMVPSAFVTLTELPRTPSGKLDRRALPAPISPVAHCAPPATETERLLAGIWGDLLGVASIGRDDNFFALGGHSLLATQMTSRVRAATGLELPLRNVFDHQSPVALAAQIDRLRAASAAQAEALPLVRLPRAGDAPAELPMSFSQDRLWFLHQLEPTSPSYNMADSVDLLGAFDLNAFELALGDLVARHEGLRTTFRMDPRGAGVQRVAPSEGQRATLAFVDLSELPNEARTAELTRLAHEHARRPFDLEEGPLFRSMILRLGAQEHVWLVAMHHIISDDWSVGILVRELSTFYAARTRGELAELPALPLQYADYALWQRQTLRGDALERELAHWQRALADAPTSLDLPADRPRPAQRSYRSGVVPIHVSPSVTRALSELARREGATLYMTLLAAFQLLLSQHSGQSDVVVGSPVANRTRGELEGLIGCFVNMLALRARVDPRATFVELLRQVRDTALEAYTHQLVPFERVVEALGLARDLGRTPIFQVLFTLETVAMEPLRLPGLTVRKRELATDASRFELELALREVDDGLRGTLDYDADLFDVETIEHLGRHLVGLLSAITESPALPLHELESRDLAERAEVAAWNATATPIEDACLHALVAAQAARTPRELALLCEDQRVTYGQLLERSGRLARALRTHGVGPDVIVAVLLERSVELVVALLGVLQAGGAYLPLDPEHPPERLAFAIDDARARVLLSSQALRARPAAHAAQLLCVDAERPSTDPTAAAELVGASVAPAHLAYVLYTSGSTGVPKAVAVSHRNVVHRLVALRDRFALRAGDRVLHKAPGTFDVSVWEIFAPLISGATVVIARPDGHRDPAYLAELIGAEQVGYVDMVPPMLAAFLDQLAEGELPRRCPSLRRVFCGGEALPRALADRFLSIAGEDVELYNLYGPTEATIEVTSWRHHSDELGGSVPIGAPLPNTQVHVLDPWLRPTPMGAPGELWIGGSQVARGYLGRPALTADRFRPDPFSDVPGARLYRTGDLARRRPARGGALEFLGRVDHQIKLRGVRIELGEIEAALLGCAEVAEATVALRADDGAEPRLVAYVVWRDARVPATTPTLEGLRQWLRASLPAHLVPATVVALPELPRTASGKLDRRALPAPAIELAPEPSAAPITPAEQLLAAIWQDLLGGAAVGRLDDFFARGGHSLLAIQVASRLGHAFGVHVPVRAVFERPVLADLADHVQQLGRRWQPPALVPVSRAQPLPLSFSQEQLWLAQLLDPQSGAYNMSAGLRIRGPARLDLLGAALGELIERHEILRMNVELREGRPQLRFSERARPRLTEEDLRELGDDETRAAELARRFDAHATRPFDLGEELLVRMACWRVGDDEVVLGLTLHHITCDGWSMNLLAREFAERYERLLAGQPLATAATEIQYADVAHWQRAWMSGEILEEHLEHFTRKLGGELPTLALPFDRPRSQRTSDAGATYTQRLSPQLGQALDKLGQSLGATLNMTLMTGFLVLLHRYSRQEDLLLGTTVAGRTCPEMDSLIGCFINNLVLRFDLSTRPTFKELVAQVRRETLEAYDHQALPFEKLLDALSPVRVPGVSPLFQVTFGVQPRAADALQLPGLELEWLRPPTETARYDLTVWVEPSTDRLNVEWTYSTELFERATIEELAAAYQAILQRALQEPDVGLVALALAAGDSRPTSAKPALTDSLGRIKRKRRAADEAG